MSRGTIEWSGVESTPRCNPACIAIRDEHEVENRSYGLVEREDTNREGNLVTFRSGNSPRRKVFDSSGCCGLLEKTYGRLQTF